MWGSIYTAACVTLLLFVVWQAYRFKQAVDIMKAVALLERKRAEEHHQFLMIVRAQMGAEIRKKTKEQNHDN